MMNSPEEAGTPHAPGPILLPKVIYPDNSVQNDSTFIIKQLEKDHSKRHTYPMNEGLAFISHLIEDFADEWLTKCMFHYRWHHDPDYASKSIALQFNNTISNEDIDSIAVMIKQRQTSRMNLVGSNPVTKPVIEEFYIGFI